MVDMTTKKTVLGFTLVELLVVIGMLSVLLSIVLVAINPSRQFAKANNTKRMSDINQILNAVSQYASDNNGTLPAAITTSVQPISNTGANICSSIVTTYIAALPTDPVSGTYTSCSSYTTGYTIVKTSGTSPHVTVTAPGAEMGETITVTR
jgi:prepilin-type N-terminal cleavage/methylation domain-containing protein